MRPSRVFGIAFAVAFWSLGVSAAFAQDLGVDEVLLKNGGSIRCTVVSVEPGTKVVILEFGQTEPRTLQWAEVADVQKGKYAPPAQDTSEEPTKKPKQRAETEADEPDQPAQGVVRVHIESDKPVELHERIGTSIVSTGRYVAAITHTRPICSAPCDTVVDGSDGQSFIIAGPGVPASREFQLFDRAGNTTIVVDAGSVGLRIGGWTLTSLGAGAIAGGATALGLGALSSSSRDAEIHYIAGGVTLAAGIGMLIGGIVMIVNSGTTVELVDAMSGADRGATASDGDFEIDNRPVAAAPRYWFGEF